MNTAGQMSDCVKLELDCMKKTMVRVTKNEVMRLERIEEVGPG